jgi:hypothetical protein
MRWAGHTACTEKKQNEYNIWQDNLKERNDLKDLSTDEILKCILKE